jgi:hypothetical protein
MDWRSRIAADPNVVVGKPVIKGTRISVELVMALLPDTRQSKSVSNMTTSRPKTFRHVSHTRVKYFAPIVSDGRSPIDVDLLCDDGAWSWSSMGHLTDAIAYRRLQKTSRYRRTAICWCAFSPKSSAKNSTSCLMRFCASSPVANNLFR